MYNFDDVWCSTIGSILNSGTRVAPRGMETAELLHRTIAVDMRRPVLTIPQRKLSYKFMAAEAYWILSGDDSVAGIAPWNKRIADFSDDGERFFGAYGPKIQDQLRYVVDKLVADPDTRQAVLTIWREKPPATKDVPCTVAIAFNIRGGFLNVSVFMRSSDAWLGLPYDVFNFSMLGHLVTARVSASSDKTLIPGSLFLTAASSHLYATNWEDCKRIVESSDRFPAQAQTPVELFVHEGELMSRLKALRDSSPGDRIRWWES